MEHLAEEQRERMYFYIRHVNTGIVGWAQLYVEHWKDGIVTSHLVQFYSKDIASFMIKPMKIPLILDSNQTFTGDSEIFQFHRIQYDSMQMETYSKFIVCG